MESKKILLIGGGGHCCSVLDSIISLNTYDEIGIIEREPKKNQSVMGVSVIGTDADLPFLFNNGWHYAFITLGSIGDSSKRESIYSNLCKEGFVIPSIIDPSAIIGSNTYISDGSFIAKRVVINAGSNIGSCAIVNTGAIVEHDCFVGDFVHISPGSTLCGEVKVGNSSHIGAGAVVRQMIKIGEGSLVGAGSVVVKDIPDGVEAFGNPCRVVKKL